MQRGATVFCSLPYFFFRRILLWKTTSIPSDLMCMWFLEKNARGGTGVCGAPLDYHEIEHFDLLSSERRLGGCHRDYRRK